MSELPEDVKRQIEIEGLASIGESKGLDTKAFIKGFCGGWDKGHRAGWNDAVETMIGMHRQLIDKAQGRIDEILTVDNEIDADRAAILRAAITNSGEAIAKLESLRKP